MKLRALRLLKLPKKILSKKLVLITIPVLIVLYLLWPKGSKVLVEYTEVKKGDVAEAVSASGVLNGKNTATLKFKSGGKLAYKNVSEGDSVNSGQVIAGLDTQDLNISLQEAENNYRATQATAEKAEDDVKDHASDETFAQKQTRTQAQAARDSAFDAVKAAKRAFQDAVIVSPISGVVTQTKPLAGQFVSATDTIAEVVDWSEVYFDTDVDEADISRVSLDQPVKVTLNSYPDKVFEGNVKEIGSSTKTTSSGSTVVTVRIDLHNPSIHLVSGLNGQAEIISKQVNNVLVIPQEALKDDNHVIAKTSQGPRLVEVKTGLKSDTDVEIISGLHEGEQVVINPTDVKQLSSNTNPLTRITRRLLPGRNVTR